MSEEILAHLSPFWLLIHIFSMILIFSIFIVFSVFLGYINNKLEGRQRWYEVFLRTFRFMSIALIFLFIIIFLSAIFLDLNAMADSQHPYILVIANAQKVLWAFMVFNFFYAYFKYTKALRAFKLKDFIEVHENLVLILHYIFALNAFVCFIIMLSGLMILGIL